MGAKHRREDGAAAGAGEERALDALRGDQERADHGVLLNLARGANAEFCRMQTAQVVAG